MNKNELMELVAVYVEEIEKMVANLRKVLDEIAEITINERMCKKTKTIYEKLFS